MGLVLMGNALLMLSSFAVQFGLFDDLNFGDSDSDAEPEDAGGAAEEEPGGNLLDYIPDDFLAETTGTAADENFVADPTQNQAWFTMEGDDTLDASDGDDYADGGEGDDVMLLRLGDDIALGGDGADTIDGGFGDDTISGGPGDDRLNGSKGNDLIFGDLGNDLLTGSDGADSLHGGQGNDTLYGNTSTMPGDAWDGADTLDGGEGDDLLVVSGGDQAIGGAGADTFQIHDPGDGAAQAEINDFDAAEDVISLVYTPMTDPVTGDPVDPLIELLPTADGTAAVLSLNGVEIAIISGGETLTPLDIALIPDVI
ncbi:MAG: calcium-binding protein [Rhodobacter sp.]|nr:calcium-binding protein [Rhodobacter sp.]